MPRRTQIFQKIPWTGGVNSSVDPGVLSSNELVQADNLVFAASSSRLKREGFDYFDDPLPAVIARSSTGTSRTLQFAASISTTVPINELIVVGERLRVVVPATAGYNSDAAIVSAISTTSLPNDTITYTFGGASSLSETLTADATVTATRNYDIIAVHDYWYFDAESATKDQLLMAITNQGLVFRYDLNGKRKQIVPGVSSPSLPATLERSSTGTVRTLKFASSLTGLLDVGSYITVANSSDGNYLVQSVPVLSLTTTTLTDDTITFNGLASYTEATATEIDAIVTDDDARTVTPLAVFPITSADTRTFNNKFLFTMSGLGNTPKYYNAADDDEPDVWKDLPGAPDGSIMQEHQSRIWMNDKTRLDYLHYCEAFNETKWLGLGDSGAIILGQGDGDSAGISSILPPFKGRLIVQKGNKTRQVIGEDPATYLVAPMSDGIGGVSHKANVAVDLDDVYFMSNRGFHSLIATDTTGDFATAFLSKKVQPTFNTWNSGRLKYTQGTYISNLNSVAWTVAESGQSKASSIWLYNPTIQGEDGQQGVWYRWPNIFAQSISTRLSDSSVRIIGGDDEGRILIGQNGRYTDYETDGINYRLKSGTIYPDGNAQTIKMFKKFGLLFKPRGRFNFTVYFKVDNAPVQAISFAQTVTGDTLGGTFILGSSSLGNASILAPYMKDVVGHGRGFSIEIFQSGADAQVEVYGYIVEYESADIADEVKED